MSDERTRMAALLAVAEEGLVRDGVLRPVHEEGSVTDRKVTVNETDLRTVVLALRVHPDLIRTPITERLRAALDALDALGPEPCGHPSEAALVGETP